MVVEEERKSIDLFHFGQGFHLSYFSTAKVVIEQYRRLSTRKFLEAFLPSALSVKQLDADRA